MADVLTECDGFVVTGVEDAANLFPKGEPFRASDATAVTSRKLTCKKGERVTVTFRARYVGE